MTDGDAREPHRLRDQVALVTGASRGLGRAVAERFAREGARVAAVARSRADLESLVDDITLAGGLAMALPTDVTDRGAVESAVADTESRFGPITMLVNNAGVGGPYGPIAFVDPDDWWRTQTIHIRGALLFMHAVLPGMRERGHGRIINMSSRAGLEVRPGLSAYCVAKTTQIRLTEHVHAENHQHGVRAFAIQPGTIVTDMARQTISDPGARRWLPDMVAVLEEMTELDAGEDLRRLGEFCVELASGRYDALSGRYLDIDADLSAGLRPPP